jgi:hypothetical protein
MATKIDRSAPPSPALRSGSLRSPPLRAGEGGAEQNTNNQQEKKSTKSISGLDQRRNLVFGAPAYTWRCAGEGELLFALIHCGPILPALAEGVNRRSLPSLSRCSPTSGARWRAVRVEIAQPGSRLSLDPGA